MILQALHQLAENDGLVDDPNFEPKPVAWIVRIGEGGKFLGLTGTRYTIEAEGRRKPREAIKVMRVPRQPDRSGTKAPAYFLVDNAKYVFGRPTADKPFSEEEGAEKSTWFREYVARCANDTGDEGAQAVLAFLESVASVEQVIELDEVCVSNDQFAFVYAPDIDTPVHERDAVEAWWNVQREEADDAEASDTRCLVTGKPMGKADLFPQIKRIPGGAPSGCGFVAYNSKTFESHGWDRNENGPVSRAAAESCATALSRLVHPAFPDPANPDQALPKRHISLGGDTIICYWSADEAGADLLDSFSDMMEGVAVDEASVGEALRAIWSGKPPPEIPTSQFYALTLSGAQGRVVVRDWFESTLDKAIGNIANYFEDIDIVRNTPKPKKSDLSRHPPLRAQLSALAPLGKSDAIPAHLASQLFHAALTGTPFPLGILQRALERARAEVGRDSWADLERRDARAALIKATLNRRARANPEAHRDHKEITPMLDPKNTNPGYALGRLMALIERMQQLALGEVNASVVDRFFAGASATPGSVFPRLMKGMRHHARKAKDDSGASSTARWLEGVVDTVAADIAEFPQHLGLEQQGLFVLGYHHQRKDLWTKKEDRQSDDDKQE